jgi:hypothetical protein
MPANAFITNSKLRTLKKRLDELIQHSQELKFLVGFFYFSGWQELYESLKSRNDLTVKLLVGLDVDRALGQALEVAWMDETASNDELAERFFTSLGIALNDDALDTANSTSRWFLLADARKWSPGNQENPGAQPRKAVFFQSQG